MSFENFNKKFLQYTPYLIQGINKQGERSSFGGNGEKGGLANEAFEKLTSFCSFPGMGAAEFENERLPKAFERLTSLLKEKKLILKTEKFGPKNVEVYILCYDDQITQIINTYQKWLSFPDKVASYKFTLPKGRDNFYETLTNTDATDANKPDVRKGWISEDSYDYPYMIFICKKMATAFVKHFYDNPDLKYYKGKK